MAITFNSDINYTEKQVETLDFATVFSDDNNNKFSSAITDAQEQIYLETIEITPTLNPETKNSPINPENEINQYTEFTTPTLPSGNNISPYNTETILPAQTSISALIKSSLFTPTATPTNYSDLLESSKNNVDKAKESLDTASSRFRSSSYLSDTSIARELNRNIYSTDIGSEIPYYYFSAHKNFTTAKEADTAISVFTEKNSQDNADAAAKSMGMNLIFAEKNQNAARQTEAYLGSLENTYTSFIGLSSELYSTAQDAKYSAEKTRDILANKVEEQGFEYDHYINYGAKNYWSDKEVNPLDWFFGTDSYRDDSDDF